MRKYKLVVLFMLMILAAEVVVAGQGRTTLLATSDPFEGGVTADLFLETRPGTGKIFIESSPLTRLDTQISTRFAKEVACNYLGRDCGELDFFYTIRANAVIIGGPSAGAAIAALTVAVLEGVELSEEVAITGTINSGNIIGQVGGISEKIEAASEAGLQKVLIPKGASSSFGRNISVDVFDYGKELGVEVVEIFSLDEVMKEFTGKTFRPAFEAVEVDPGYSKVMEDLASDLCQRTEELAQNIESVGYDNQSAGARDLAENLSSQGTLAVEENSFYAAASYCFGANVRYKFVELTSKNITDAEIKLVLNEVARQVVEFEDGLDNASTVSDAQILAVVLDRIGETKQHINNSLAALDAGLKDSSVFELSFAIERLKSADAWSKFFGVMEESEITADMLKNACVSKLSEAQERIEYATILIRGSSDGARARLLEAQRFLDDENYVQCLHRATLSKSEATTLLSVVGVTDEEIREIVDRKIDAARTSIARQTKKEIFPIVGYSYFEYANSLKETDVYSALLFSDYALEFSNLDIYFKKNLTGEPFSYRQDRLTGSAALVIYFIAGIVVGGLLTAVVRKAHKKKRILINKAAKRTHKVRKS